MIEEKQEEKSTKKKDNKDKNHEKKDEKGKALESSSMVTVISGSDYEEEDKDKGNDKNEEKGRKEIEKKMDSKSDSTKDKPELKKDEKEDKSKPVEKIPEAEEKKQEDLLRLKQAEASRKQDSQTLEQQRNNSHQSTTETPQVSASHGKTNLNLKDTRDASQETKGPIRKNKENLKNDSESSIRPKSLLKQGINDDVSTPKMSSFPNQKQVNPTSKTISKKQQIPKKDNMNDANRKKKNKKSLFLRIKEWYLSLNLRSRIVLIVMLTLSFIFLLAIIAMLLELDSYIIPSSITGRVVNQEAEPIEGARVCLSDICTTTESNGSYVIGDLRYGSYMITVSAKDYRDHSQQISIKRGRSEFDFTLEPSGYGEVYGFIETGDSELEKVDIRFEDELIELNEDGTFLLSNIPVGDYEITVESPYYLDQKMKVEVLDGENRLDTIDLEPAGDLTGQIVDWVSLQELVDASIELMGENYETNENGVYEIKDLEPGSVEMKVTAEGYNTKTIKLELEAGNNDISDTELVRSGRVVYVSNRLGNENVYIADYDGSNEKLLSDNKGDSNSPYLSSDNTTVYFLSTREAIKGENENLISMVYSVPANGGAISKITKTEYEGNNGYIGSYDYESMKRVYTDVTYGDPGTDEFSFKAELYVGNIDGTGMKLVKTVTDGSIGSTVFANDGSFLLYTQNDQSSDDSGVYRLDLSSQESEKLMANSEGESAYVTEISSDRSRSIIRKFDNASKRWDLWIVGTFDGTVKRLTNSSTFESQPFFTQGGTTVSFISTRDGKTDVYSLSAEGGEERKVTDNGKVDDYFFGDDDLMFFNSEKKMLVTDFLVPKQAKEVTDSVLGTYYSSRYNYYVYE